MKVAGAGECFDFAAGDLDIFSPQATECAFYYRETLHLVYPKVFLILSLTFTRVWNKSNRYSQSARAMGLRHC